MIKPKSINLNSIKISFRLSPKTLADRAFLIFLGFLSISLIIGGIIFYRYNNLIGGSPSTSTENLQFKEKAYKDVLRFWQGKEEKLGAIDSKEYPDPFSPAPQKLTK